MAIRCAELGIPAAIGVGTVIFDTLRAQRAVVLDCDNQRILPVP